MAQPQKPPFTQEQLETWLKESLIEEYQEIRKRVRQNGIKSLSEGERDFFLNYDSTKSLKPRGSTKG